MLQPAKYVRSIDWSIDWLIDRLINRKNCRSIDRVKDFQTLWQGGGKTKKGYSTFNFLYFMGKPLETRLKTAKLAVFSVSRFRVEYLLTVSTVPKRICFWITWSGNPLLGAVESEGSLKYTMSTRQPWLPLQAALRLAASAATPDLTRASAARRPSCPSRLGITGHRLPSVLLSICLCTWGWLSLALTIPGELLSLHDGFHRADKSCFWQNTFDTWLHLRAALS